MQEEARKSESDVASSNLKKCCQIRLRSIGKEDEICRTSSAEAAICDAPRLSNFSGAGIEKSLASGIS